MIFLDIGSKRWFYLSVADVSTDTPFWPLHSPRKGTRSGVIQTNFMHVKEQQWVLLVNIVKEEDGILSTEMQDGHPEEEK